jgi:protein TonB
MEKMQILTADLLEIIFDGRNKNYGAYDLRKSYSRRMEYALAGTAFICLMFIVGNLLASKSKIHEQLNISTEVSLSDFKEKEKKQEIIEPPKVEKKQIATEQYNAPIITPDKDVKPEEELKEIDALEAVKIGNQHIDGDKDDGITAAPLEALIGNTKLNVDETDYDLPFNTVQIQAHFPGDISEWTKFLQKNLNSDLPVQNGAPAGVYTVIVSFVVDKTGMISDVQAENDPGFGTKAEAIRAIRKGPNWIPAEQNGRKVIYRQKQSISFRVSEE